MCVKIALQCIASQSVVRSLLWCHYHKISGFESKDVISTAKFIALLDQIFDIMNTKSPHGQGLKSPLSWQDTSKIQEVFANLLSMIKNLKQMDGTYLYQGERICGFLGLVSNIMIIKDLLIQMKIVKLNLEYLLFFKALSRSPRGIFLSSSTLQWRQAIEETSVLTMTPEALDKDKAPDADEEVPMEDILPELCVPHIKSGGCRDTEYLVCQGALAYIGEYIDRSLSKTITCSECCEVLHHNQGDPCPVNSLIVIKSYSPLLTERYNGKKGLTIP